MSPSLFTVVVFYGDRSDSIEFYDASDLTDFLAFSGDMYDRVLVDGVEASDLV